MGDVAHLSAQDAGTLTLLDFWKQHNEHRHCIPKMVMYVLALATKWNVVAEMWFTQAMLLAMLVILLGVLWRECASPYCVWLMVPVAFLAMGLRQSQNLLFGWQIGFVMIATSAVATLYCLYLMNRPRLRGWKFAGAIAAGTVATCSGGSGPLVWIAGLVPLELLPLDRRRKTLLFGAWAFLGVVEWCFYFWGYQTPPKHPSIHLSWEHGLEIVREGVVVRAGVGAVLLLLQYGLTVVGGALSPALLIATTAGVVIMLLAAASTVLSLADKDRGTYSFWLGIIVFSLLAGGATTVGRAGYGPDQALSTRYATFSELAVIGVYGILSCMTARRRAVPVAAMWGCLFGLIAVGLVVSTFEGFEIGAKEKLAKEYHAFVLSTIDTQPDEVARAANESADPIREGVVLLKKHGWNVYAPGGTASHYVPPPVTLPVLAAPAQVALSQFGVPKDAKYLTIGGWATNAEGSDAVGGVFLDIDGTLYPTFYGMPSPGLGKWMANARAEREAQAAGSAGKAVTAQRQMNDRLEQCGFQRAFAPGLLAKGRHRLTLKVLTKDGAAFFASPLPAEFTVE